MPEATGQTETHRPAPIALRVGAAMALLAASWFGMMAVHELGHALAGWAGGGSVRRVVLPWLGFSRTDLAPNPRPLAAAWAGPIVGVLLPMLGWVFARFAYPRAQSMLRFFAGWCLVCNGAYLGLGWIDRVGDAGDLLRHGASRWQLIAFGVISFGLGLWLWHGLGPDLRLQRATRVGCRRLLAVSLGIGLFYGASSIALG